MSTSESLLYSVRGPDPVRSSPEGSSHSSLLQMKIVRQRQSSSLHSRRLQLHSSSVLIPFSNPCPHPSTIFVRPIFPFKYLIFFSSTKPLTDALPVPCPPKSLSEGHTHSTYPHDPHPPNRSSLRPKDVNLFSLTLSPPSRGQTKKIANTRRSQRRD